MSPFESIIADVMGGKIAIQDPDIGDFSVLFGTDGEMGQTVVTAFGGSIEDFPVDQRAVAGDSDRARADSAQGK